MHRIDNETATLAPPTMGLDGPHPNSFFNHTTISIDWLNSIQEEVCYVIETAGLTLDKADQGQLLAAIQQIVTDAGVIPPPAGGGGNLLNTNGFNILSSTSDIAIDAGTEDLRISANNLLGSGTVLGGGTTLQLPTGVEIKGFYNSTTDYLLTGVVTPYITPTQKVIIDMITHYYTASANQIIYGAVDALDNYFFDLGSAIGNGWGPLFADGLPVFPFSFPSIDAVSTDFFVLQLISLDVWTDNPTPSGGGTLQFWIGTSGGHDFSSWSCTVPAGETHAQITPTPASNEQFQASLDQNIGFTSLFSSPVTRVSYRLIFRSIPI